MFLLIFSQILLAQPQVAWQKSIGGSNLDWIRTVKPTSDGGYVAIGYSESSNGDLSGNQGKWDVWVVKLTNLGAITWQRNYGGSNREEGNSIQQTSDGGYIVCGSTQSNNGDVSGNHGLSDAWIMKLSPTGNVVWQQCYGGSANEYGRSVLQTSDGGYLFAGLAASQDGDVVGLSGPSDAWVVKLDANGTIVWQKCIGGTVNDGAYAITRAAGGGYILVGNTSVNLDFQVLVAKITETGTVAWQKIYGGPSPDFALSVEPTSDGGSIVGAIVTGAGWDVQAAYGFEDLWILKLDSLGAITWQKTLGGTDNDWVYSASETSDGGYVVAGSAQSNDWDLAGQQYGEGDCWIVKLDSSGQLVWKKNYGGAKADVAQCVLPTSDGSYIVAGSSKSNNVDVSGNHGDWDGWIYKLSFFLDVGVDQGEGGSAIEVFPNPASDYLKIRTHPELNGSSFSVYDALGRVVAAGTIGEGETVVVVEHLASGVHFVRLHASGESVAFVKE